jgi:2-oxoglutarate dehydrogenase complex dehydrogenase (E1) component-like enzyme
MDLQNIVINNKRFRQIGLNANGVATFRSHPDNTDDALESLPQISFSAREPKQGRGAKTVLRLVKPRVVGHDENLMPIYRNGRIELSIVHTPGARAIDRTELVEFLQHVLANENVISSLRDGEVIL